MSAEDGNRVFWSARSRADYSGYFILRAEASGAFHRVTAFVPNAAESFPATFSWFDDHVEAGGDYAYRIEVIRADGTSEEWDRTINAHVPVRLPGRLTLRIVGPNPFRAAEGLAFEMKSPVTDAHATVHAFDMSGRFIATIFDGPLKAGTQGGRWEGTDGEPIPAGRYVLRLEAGDQTAAAMVFLVR